MAAQTEITGWLLRWSDGEPHAESQLMRLVVPEMRKLARRYLRRERAGHTLQPTALVNEAYLQLIDARGVRLQDRAHFFALAARIMRNILVDHARRRLSSKRQGAALSVTLTDELPAAIDTPDQLIALSDSLDELAHVDPRKARVIELRFFGGLSVEETAAILKVSPNTVIRDWSLARAWLLREMHPHATVTRDP
jgi:RNA polymerase sigma factor (TIGR02999 family)